MDPVKATEFARRKGVSTTLVYRALSKGRIVFIPGTKTIDWDTQAEAFENNCNLKFKLAARTKGDLSRAIVSGEVKAVPIEIKPPPPKKPRPPKPVHHEDPEPEPVRKPVPAKPSPEKPDAVVAPVIKDPEIPKLEIPRKPKIPEQKREPTPSQLEDMEAEKAAARDRDAYNKARTAEQVLKAQLLQIELKQKQKELMPVPEVRKGVQKMAEFLMKGMQAIPDRICDELAGMNDPSDIHALMTKEINNVLEELANAARAVAS